MPGALILLATEAPTLGITADMLKPISDAVVSNVGVILPACIGIFGIMIGVKLVPKLFAKFIHS